MRVHNSGLSIIIYQVSDAEYDQIQDSDLSMIVYQSFIREYDHIHDLDLSIIVYQVVDEVPPYTFLPFLNNPNRHTREKIQTFNNQI